MKKTVLSGLSLRVLVLVMVGTLIVVALAFAGRLDHANGQDFYAFLAICLILILTIMAAVVSFIRLSALQTILLRLDSLLKRHFRDKSRDCPVALNDECAQIDFALQLLVENMNARERSERSLRQHQRISASILNALYQAVIVTDSQGNIIQFSQGAEKMLGYSADEVIGKRTLEIFHDPDEILTRAEKLTEELGVPVKPGFQTLIAKARINGQAEEREWTYIRKDGARLVVLLSIAMFDDGQGNNLACVVAMDITERSRVAAKILRLANYDALTRLPNRRLFRDRFHAAIIQARRKKTNLGLLMIDLDRFKPVNDQYGHSNGDILLDAVAKRMKKCLRESDTLARVGGDEFVAILPMRGNSEGAVGVAEKIRQSLSSPFELTSEITVTIGCCIGVAIYPDHGKDEESLMKSADEAMYLAKEQGRDRVCVASVVEKTNESKDAPRLMDTGSVA
jgi:diguanylate cyclase (GGDEF)-like protein/PAS domain S-box-containing protein